MRTEISTYYSDDGVAKAIVYFNGDIGHYEVEYQKAGRVLSVESYREHNLYYHEDAAENFVLGVKKFS